MNRSDIAVQLKNEAMIINNSLQSEYYTSKKYDPMYPKFCKIKKLSDMEWTSPKRGGGSAYIITNSIIGVTEMVEINEAEPVKFADPMLGFSMYLKKRKFGIATEMTFELNRDFKALKKDLEKWMTEENFPESFHLAKERFAAGMINEGAYTAGSKFYDNSLVNIVPSYGSLGYDAVPLFALTGAPHTNKVGTTYYNHIGDLKLTYDNLVTADTLLMSTNAYTENDTPFRNDHDNFVMYNPALRLTGMRLINSTLVPENNNNDVNPLSGAYKTIANPFMTNVNAWVAGNKNAIHFFDSDDIRVEVWKVPETDQVRMKAIGEFACAEFDFRGLVGSYLGRS